MTRLIRSLPFLYGAPVAFLWASFHFRQWRSAQVIIWGLFVAFLCYLYFVEKIAPALPALLPVAIYIADYIAWGNGSPLVALLFAALPLVLARRPAHYPWYAALALASLIIPGHFDDARQFSLYILFALVAVLIYFSSREELLRRIFGDNARHTDGPHREAPRQAVEDPHLAILKYCERMRLWNTVPVCVKAVELRDEEGLVVGADAPFRMTGLILLAVKNRCAIPCTSLLEEKEHLPLLPEYNKRVYFPVNLFEGESALSAPDYVVVIDAFYDGDKQVLVDMLLPLRDDVMELLRMAATFERILSERKRQEKLFRGAREMLDSFERERLFNASAWSVLNFVPDAATVLITEYRDGDHRGSIYRMRDEAGEPLSLEKIAPVQADELRDAGSIQAMMIEGKVGKMTEIRDINKRRDRNQIFSEGPFADLNRHAQMLTFLLQHQDAPQGTLSVFLDSDRAVEMQTKSDLSLLSRILSSALNNIEMYETVRNLSNIDGLTGLYNRRYLQERIEHMTGEAARSGIPLSVIMLDIDHFKKVNDRYGHKAGDDVIRFLSRVVKNSIRKVDIAARYGGEEFFILLHNTTHDGALKVAEKIREIVEGAVVPADGNQINITSSFGVSSYPDLAQNAGDLVKTADDALYESKESGRNRVTLYAPKPS